MDNISLKYFYKRFPNDEACLTYLEQLRWPELPVCPHCGSVRTYKYKNGRLFKCGTCRKQFTVTVGTIFTKSHVHLQEWFLAVFLSTSQPEGITSVKLAEYLEVTQKTAWSMLRRIRYGLSHDGSSDAQLMQQHASPFDFDDVFAKSVKKLTSTPSSKDRAVGGA